MHLMFNSNGMVMQLHYITVLEKSYISPKAHPPPSVSTITLPPTPKQAIHQTNPKKI